MKPQQMPEIGDKAQTGMGEAEVISTTMMGGVYLQYPDGKVIEVTLSEWEALPK